MSLTSQEIRAVEGFMRRNHCAVCGGGFIWPRADAFDVRCAVDATHKGYERNRSLRAECEAGRGPIGLNFKRRTER